VDDIPEDSEPGNQLTVDIFEEVNSVDVVGTSKGKGFAGVMRRYNFGGLRATHGTKRKDRHPGSIGGHGTDLGKGGKIKKGKRMAGRMGGCKVTTRKCSLVRVDKENGLLLIKGPVPGARGGYLVIKKSRTGG
jgi:large subunit ribosomal protein L3